MKLTYSHAYVNIVSVTKHFYMSEIPSPQEQLPHPERQVMILGPRLRPLFDRLGVDQFDGEIEVAAERTLSGDSDRTYSVSEDEAIQDYFDFLAEVTEVSGKDTAEDADSMHDVAVQFAAETTYLSVVDKREAVRGIALSQTDFLDANKDQHLVYFVSQYKLTKSQGRLVDDTVSYIQTSRPDLSERVRVLVATDDVDLSVLEGVAAAKVVLLDDWMVTGAQMNDEISKLRQVAEASNIPQLLDNVEVNLLVGRGDQVIDNFEYLDRYEKDHGLKSPINVRTYFTTPAIPNPLGGPTPTGAHSSVDYGFGNRVGELHRYIASKTKEEVPFPLLARIKKREE